MEGPVTPTFRHSHWGQDEKMEVTENTNIFCSKTLNDSGKEDQTHMESCLTSHILSNWVEGAVHFIKHILSRRICFSPHKLKKKKLNPEMLLMGRMQGKKKWVQHLPWMFSRRLLIHVHVYMKQLVPASCACCWKLQRHSFLWFWRLRFTFFLLKHRHVLIYTQNEDYYWAELIILLILRCS